VKTTYHIAAAALVMLAASDMPAAARSGIIGYVTAHSDYGNGSVRGAVRLGQYGRQVQLPGGTWVDCVKPGLIFRRNRPCTETLRMETVDFWESQPSFHNR